MRALTACLALAVGAVQCPVGYTAVSTVWTATKVHGEVHELGQPADQPRQQQVEEGSGGNRKPWEDVPAQGLGFAVSSPDYPPATGSPWAHTAEPFRDTTFRAVPAVGNPAQDVFKWTFEDGTVFEGREVNYTFRALGPQQVLLSQIVVSTGVVHQAEASVMVKYMRREIRALTGKDREAFFDAMETLYRLPVAEGKRLYGDAYKGIEFFVQMHLDGAGVKDCDHWHDDAGIMTHHVGYTLLFEQALQVVDPAVSIPYWEFTIESSRGQEDYGPSEVFGADWFGDASPDNSLHTVDEGRWAYLPVMKGAWDYVHNPYGLLRSPWNTDPTPYVTRHNMTNGQDSQGMVSCEDYQDCFDYDALADVNNCLNGGTHGPVHIKVGGEWDDPEQDIIQALSYSNKVPLISKFLWRKGYLRVPTSCSSEEGGAGDSSACRTSCPAELYESRGMTAYDVLMDVHALYWIADETGGILVMDQDKGRFTVAGHEGDEDFEKGMWARILSSLCDPGHVGELYMSSAPYDPLFWVIHPTAERFLGWRRKLAREEPDSRHALDETWGYTHGNVIGETGVVCDWSGVREDSLDMPACVKGICGGHRADDVLPFEVKVKGEVRSMSNQEWLDFIYPDNEELPYMYDSFNWGHCARDGYPLGGPGF